MSYLRNINATEIDASKLGVDDELLALLYDIGILGCVRSYFVNAAAIFEGYKAVKPQSELARMGMGLLALSIPTPKDAVNIFKDEVLAINPENDIARAYLGLAHQLCDEMDDAKKAWNAVIDANRDETAVSLAKAALARSAESS